MKVLDSATPPTANQVAQAKAAGFSVWLGYVGQHSDNLLHPWASSDFMTVISGGLRTGAFCSGVDDPTWVRQEAESLDVRLLWLDVEDGIKSDGAWVEPWVATAGAGIYGNGSVIDNHPNASVPSFVLAAYPNQGNQTATWDSSYATLPSKPHGWQWAGTVSMFGTTVDLSNYDDSIFAGGNMECEDPTTGGVWEVDPRDGHVEASGGAPYLGGMNPDRWNWQSVGTISGIAPEEDSPGGEIGYTIAVERFQPNPDGTWFSNYHFPRDGSLK